MQLELQDIKKSFDGNEILHGISFKAQGGRALGLLGRNGAGKTTTIRIIMDVFRADSGVVLLDGEKFSYKPGEIAYLPEERGLYPKRIISEQLIYLAMLRGLNKKQATSNMKKYLEKLQVSEYENRKLDTLSKGNQQKVQLAATLISDPQIVILDEPFSGLDPVNARILKDVILELIEQGKIVIFSSHQMSYVEEFCEDIVIINNGSIVLSGDLDEIKSEYGHGRKVLAANNYSPEDLAKKLQAECDSLVQVLGHNKQYVILKLAEGIDQWQLLSDVKNTDIDIKTFGSYEPSLNDIFVSKVGEEKHS